MTALLQISDTHFGTEQPAVVEALLRLAKALAPEAVLLSGDITQRARRSQFDAASAFVARLGSARVLALPGNHDIPLFNPLRRLLRPYGNYRRAFGDDLEPEHASAELLLIGVNTTRAWRHVDGEVSAAQVERVACRLGSASALQLRVVAVHQPVAVTRPDDEANLLHGGEHAVRRWAAAGADVIVGGHIHLPFVVALHERDATLARRIWAVQAGTAISSRVRPGAGNSVNVLRFGAPQPARRCSVERWDYHVHAAAFELAATHELGLSPAAHAA